MKIHCDVCDKDEASVFCIADEAALCAACDQRVHHANKLAGKHQRYSLHHPSPNQAPLCDICQERRAFLFCQQDRAILCRECDIPIHKANEHTQKHTRFLLTGVKLSASSALYSSSLESAKQISDVVPKIIKSQDSKDNKPLLFPPVNTPSTSKTTTLPSPESCEKSTNSQLMNGGNSSNGSISGSSISEYLIEMLPGWHVEDLLDSSFPSTYGFCKNGDDDVIPFWDADLESNINAFPTENMRFWVPQVPPPLNQTQNQSSQSMDFAFGAPNGNKEQFKEFSSNNIKSSRKWNEDSSFVVPQISPPFSSSKRSRTSW
ncbi:hypothetical protein CDL12_03371 [Handroanthus impetiginosus]|uniref:B box-type domain-containing protein n=1 Tax=Handroanthus impetiginosus TaxID=429701 RepID=A0A2G9I2D4_9LAMI|nr:hypothetical protein CDL12_22496 [Handroanthus impetiginosus]PIN23914.1 hypothetical protein CDL12_03371 [Handroanthus impetiginosus]